jgi:uncharacterized membrane protein YphA (DoxX/SURF4 family)
MTAMRGDSDVRARRSRGRSAAEWGLSAIRLTAAVVFVVFGAGKFANHASELASFRSYGLALPDVFVSAIGVLELGGGLLLLAGRWVRLAALALAADMIGAIFVSGIGRGEVVSLTLAPALLVAMIALIRFGPGRARPGRSWFRRAPR